MAKLIDDAGEWLNSLTRPAKRLRMYQVHGRMLGIKTTTTADDFAMPAKRLRMYQVHCQMLGIMTTTIADDVHCQMLGIMTTIRHAGETFENVPSPLSDAGNYDNYYGSRRNV
ncbi:unnamed protein product [Protopolystoma xenopodis]|uniref:Uncharacterized protein n=1 Tax=Protopolystoma xenopodis TaxID=117903 RepID=A0A3S4ZPR5_9PLAT|nr:unnamed protein product [Protopolystoma xenopodis]